MLSDRKGTQGPAKEFISAGYRHPIGWQFDAIRHQK